MLTPPVAAALERALEPHFGEAGIVEVTEVGGGCISTTLQVRLRQGTRVFVKLASASPPGGALLEAEAHSLAALRTAGAVRVPQVLARGRSWLALEWLEPGRGGRDTWERLGQELAALHRVQGPAFGWDRDNFIGSLPQANQARSDWAAFWWEQRLQPQLALATGAGMLTGAEARRFAVLPEVLPQLLEAGQAEGPSLLHGDLWSGNVHVTATEACLVDPASYYGHREVDLAMAALFGGFPPAFYQAYAEAWPLTGPGAERRRACYQLYYLLVHVNLFGRGYLAGASAALERALG